ncbi:GNAT family N-acetyltransferase [Mesobacillus maritimus]|uniref:GNAT family N-acetyltransferase n=1 Tax=Mesobacillus maritimus TaxID=1643336 RepID=UPI00203AA5AC|nr:GNAT family N-acetyltransferase [Mesobacillus maritimus]MCM3588365.1 GNAT family N-acetyltransferase [Mesobacillus maritimus]MCM3672014.1 GNAT family N-acetyltransferase [Mesobacillus maritimus]
MKTITTIKIHPSIRELLAFTTSGFMVDEEYEKYLKITNRKLYAYESQGKFVGCIGIEIVGFNECVIKHIAVSPEQRGKGIGSKMIQSLSEQYPFISAETDIEAVDFYRKYGFAITSLGEKYPGVERFLCEYEGRYQ